MITQNKQDKSFSPGKKEAEIPDEKKKSFEQGLQNNNTADEEETNPLPDKRKKKDTRDDKSEPVEERSDKLNQ